MRAVTLNATKAGMTRLREKGGADPNTLFDLTNGYVNASKVPVQRPGTRFKFTWPANTKGLMAFKDVLYAFSATPIDTGSSTHKVLCLRHPVHTNTDKIKTIHFSAPFLGYPYVVAEFDNGEIFHYWLQIPQTWVANHDYVVGDLVQPTVPNGYFYRASTDKTPQAWAPGVPRTIGDIIQPTVANGWFYTCSRISAHGGVSGSVEPLWPTVEDAVVTEYVEAAVQPTTPSAPADPPQDPTDGNYNNPGGGGGGGGGLPGHRRPIAFN